jgi:phosphate-selective porin OprO/OprP
MTDISRSSLLLTLVLVLAASPAVAAPTDARIDALERELAAMKPELIKLRSEAERDSRIEALGRQLESLSGELAEIRATQRTAQADILTLKAPSAPSPTSTVASLPNGRPTLATADGRFSASLRSFVQLDLGSYMQNEGLSPAVAARDLSSGTNFRRARFGVEGRLFGDFDYTLIYDFGGSGGEDTGRLYEASVIYTGLEPVRIELGAWEQNAGLASAVLTSQMAFLERPSPSHLNRTLAAGNSRVGLAVISSGRFGDEGAGPGAGWFAHGAVTGGTISTVTATGAGAAPLFDEQVAVIGRVAISPYMDKTWRAHLGANFQRVLEPADAGLGAAIRYPLQLRDRPELRVDGTRLVDTGPIDSLGATSIGLEAGLTAGPVLVEGEWTRIRFDRRGPALSGDPRFEGWYLQGSWAITGERRAYDPADARFSGFRPNQNFDLAKGTWGAFELAARYSVTDLNYNIGRLGAATPLGGVRGGEQRITTLGVNWQPNGALRLMLHWQQVEIDRLNAAGADMSQDYDAVAARAQIAF